MQEISNDLQKISLYHHQPSSVPNLLKQARNLLGVSDADSWYQRHIQIFTHPRFTEDPVSCNDHSVVRMMQHLGIDSETVWVHTHPHWHDSFGVWIVRRGKEIIYEGREESKVKYYLGLKSCM